MSASRALCRTLKSSAPSSSIMHIQRRCMSGDADHARAEMYRYKTVSKYAAAIIGIITASTVVAHFANHQHFEYVEMPYKQKNKPFPWGSFRSMWGTPHERAQEAGGHGSAHH